MIRLALDYAAEHPLEIRERIKRNRDMIERSREAVNQRADLLSA